MIRTQITHAMIRLRGYHNDVRTCADPECFARGGQTLIFFSFFFFFFFWGGV